MQFQKNNGTKLRLTMQPYKSPLKTLALIIFCIIIALMLREIVRAENVESGRMDNDIQYEALECPRIKFNTQKELTYYLSINEAVQGTQPTQKYTITAYCSCEKCCGEWASKRGDGPVIGAYGVELTPDYSVAAPLPYGTKLIIDGMTYEVQDTTASWIVDRYSGKIIDIYVGNSHEEAIKIGKQEMEVEIVD